MQKNLVVSFIIAIFAYGFEGNKSKRFINLICLVMATLTITANAKSANRRDVFTSRMESVSKETATLFLQSAIDEVLKPYGGRGKFGVEWDFSSENTKVICFVQRGVEVVVTATLF